MVGFMAGSIVSKMMLDTTKWSNSIKVVKGDEGTLKGMAARTSKGFKKVGRAMTVAGTAIVTGLALAVNKAADAQETFAKFETVFDDVGDKAEGMALDLQKSFGLSEVAAKDMLGATGDLLTGLGMGADVALDLSAKTQQLSVDLASFTNFSGGAKGASEALTKAMLGERESVKALGIVITQEMVNEQLLADGKSHLTGLAQKQAQAEATLKIAVSQSKNAIGDYARTSDSLVNQKRLLAAQAENLVTTLGTHLIPIVTTLVTKVTGIVTKFNEWAKENPKVAGTIIKIAAGVGALAAGLGPIVIMLPKIVGAVDDFKKSLKKLNVTFSLSTVAIGLVVVALAALVIGYMKVKAAQDEAEKSARNYNEVATKFEDKLKGIATEAGLTAEQFEELKAKYKGNINVMALAIKKGEEGVELQKAMNEKGKENIQLQEDQKKAQEAMLPSLSDLAAGMDTVGTSAASMGTKIKEISIPAIMQLELDLINLKDEYDSHNLTLDEYIQKQIDIETRLKKLKGGFEEVELAVEDADIEILGMGVDLDAMITTAIADAGTLGTTIGGLPKDFVKAARETKTKVKTWWTETTDGMKTKWGNMWSSFLKGPISLKSFGDAFKAFGEGIKQQFADLIGNMVAKWTTGFLEQLVSGTAASAGKVANSIAGVGKSALKLATNFSPGGIVASAVGSAVGTFLGNILGPKGPSANDARLNKEYNYLSSEHNKNAVANLDSIKWAVWGFTPILDAMKLTLWDQTEILGMINDKLGTPPTGEGRNGRGGTPNTAGTPTAPGGINIGTIKQQVNINGIMISERKWARDTLIPEIFHALKQRALKRELQSILGMG